MSVEHRLVAALRAADRLEPSEDLWQRVLHSIEEDRAHRRRVVASVAASLGALVGLTAVVVSGLRVGVAGRYVLPPVMELVETVAAILLVAVLGPAVRRFGRGFAHDLWPATPAMADHLLRLLDVAYWLVSAGYLLLTVELGPGLRPHPELADQLAGAADRLGGLVLLLGLNHVATLAVLPVVALLANSTRTGRRLPRWVVVLLVVVATQILPGLPLVFALVIEAGR